MFENLHKISLISIEKAPITQPNIYSLEWVGHGGSVVVKRTPVRLNSNSAEFHTWVVLPYPLQYSPTLE